MMLLKELEHATGFDTPDLATKKDFITLKAEIDMNKLVNCPASLNNFNYNSLDVGELKTVPPGFTN